MKTAAVAALAFAALATVHSCRKSGPDPAVSYPEYTEEAAVTIRGYEADAMEPFITRDGRYLFFNSLNDGQTTSLYYARRENDTTFAFQGEMGGVNGSPPHLDAVASMDENDIFYVVSTRNYPTEIRNYLSGRFENGLVRELAPVEGDFYIRSPAGWIVMDAEISEDGGSLYYVNARFAPATSSGAGDLYFTRIRKGTLVTELCVSVLDTEQGVYSTPKRVEMPGEAVEAPTLTSDGTRIYYHKKLPSDGRYHVFTMRRKDVPARNSPLGVHPAYPS